MKKLITLCIAVLACLITIAQRPKGTTQKGMIFGAKTNVAGAVIIDDLSKKVPDKQETNVKVKGKVVEVCTQMGCWLKMETADGKIMVKMKDHSFFVPVDLNGKEIVVDGTAKMTVTPVSELKHYAEDAGKSKEEVAVIKEPKTEIVIDAKGVLVL
jgi:hypothetical protein